MKRSAIVTFFAAILSLSAVAQSVQEGLNHLYSQRYQSAESTFEKLIASNPNNLDAHYWLGQTHLAQKDVAAAKAVYDKAAASSNNAPLIMVGKGHVALLEGRAAEARQQFETAINATKGRKGNDPNILNAVGRANVEVYTEATKLGDLDYAITRLQEAAKIAPNNADIYVNLGNAFRKKRDSNSGSEAVLAFRKAAELNKALAIAPYRTAMLYKTQVRYQQPDAWNVVLENLNNAIAADPSFAPAYEELYYYYLLGKKDFATAETFATKYITNSDPSVENDYLKAQTDFVQGKFTAAISTAKNIISQTNNNAKSRVYRLLGYSYLENKDTTTACQYVNEFFAKASEDEIIGQDYLLHAQTCGKGDPEAIRADIYKAVMIDSVLSRQVTLLDDAAQEAKKNDQRILEAELRLMSYKLRGERTSPTELISYIALPYFFGGAYEKADSAARAYAAIAPDSIYGHYWSALALAAIDTTMEQGLAMEAFKKTLEIAETDKERFKSQGVRAAQTLAIYYNNVKADKEAAVSYVNRGLVFDPTHSTLNQISKMLGGGKPTSSKPAQKTTTSSGGR